jgi:hypothetical protein
MGSNTRHDGRWKLPNPDNRVATASTPRLMLAVVLLGLGSMRVLAAFVLVLTACSSGPDCGDTGVVALRFDRTYDSRYHGTLRLGGRSLSLDCPEDVMLEDWHVTCQSDAILVSGPGLDVRATAQVELNLIGADGMVVTTQQAVLLGPVFAEGHERVCERDGALAVFQPPSPPTASTILSISPTSRDYGPVSIGVSGFFATFIVTNRGDEAADISRVTVTGDFVLDRSISGGGCDYVPLPPGDHCTIFVGFGPSRVGDRSGTLVVTEVTGATVMATLRGEGVGHPHPDATAENERDAAAPDVGAAAAAD